MSVKRGAVSVGWESAVGTALVLLMILWTGVAASAECVVVYTCETRFTECPGPKRTS